MNFDDLRLDERLLRAAGDLKFERPTAVQEQVIPLVLDGRDVLGRSQTGTGKTAAFGLPILDTLLRGGKSESIRVLVIEPTREMAFQAHEHLKALAAHTELRGEPITGGSSDTAKQEHRLRVGCDWVAATPGRLRDLLQRGVDMNGLQFLVLDEADQLLELGFLDDLQSILSYLPERRSTLLFSATLPPEMRSLADLILRNPAVVEVGPTATAEPLDQEVYRVSRHQKTELLLHLLDRMDQPAALVFTRTRRGADSLVKRLGRAGREAEVLHADRTMPERRAALQAFAEGNAGILVATDVAARGLDISRVTHVINYDVPGAPEDYVHRVGRTARAGRSGLAITLMTPEEEALVARIERLLGRRLPEIRAEGFEYEDAPEGESLRGRPHHLGSLRHRPTPKGRKESPFTKTGKVRNKYALPTETSDARKKKKKKVKLRNKRLPHQR